jgi:uncharacterized XkdX family phage protein
MDWFGMIKRYYDAGFWSKEQVAQAVSLSKITAAQYEEITGITYE